MPSNDPPFQRFHRLAATLGRERFVAQHPHLFLFRAATEGSDPTDSPWDDPFAFATHVPDLADLDDDEREGDGVVAPVKKREGGPFPDRIGIGRARNCDVVLRFPSVSKLHAQILVGGGGALALVDLGSANGTTVDGQRLLPRAPQPIVVGARLLFGAVEVELLDAGQVFERL